MVARERLVLYLAGVFLFAAAFGYTYARFGARLQPPQRPPSQVESVLQEGAEVVLRYVSQSGVVSWTEVVRADPELVGLSLAELRSLRPDWSVLSFAPTRLVVDLTCEPEGPGGFLREVEGHVAIFSGVPNGCHELLELTDIKVTFLSEAVQDAVVQGIPFDDGADLPQILEGLTSTR